MVEWWQSLAASVGNNSDSSATRQTQGVQFQLCNYNCVCIHPLLYPHHRDVSSLLSPTAISRRGLCSTLVCSLEEDKPVITTYGVKSLYLLTAPRLTKRYYRSGCCTVQIKLLYGANWI